MGEPQSYNYKELLGRVGTFFVIVAIGLLALFVLSESAEQTVFPYFCWSTILFGAGFFLRSRFKKAAGPASGRFGILKRLRPKPKEEKK